MDRSADRLEEAAKNVNTFGKVLLNEYVNAIDSVKVDQVTKAVSQVLSRRPTFVAVGGGVHRLHTYDNL